MPQPLPDAVVATLKTDSCAALAAIVIISNAHSELLAWAQRSLSPLTAGCDVATNIAADQKNVSETNGAGKAAATGVSPAPPAKPRKANGEGGRAKGRRNPREGAAKHDQALLALMRANPGASVTEIIRMNRRPRNSTVLSLDRLEKAGLIEHARRGEWTVIPPGSDPGADLLEAPAPRPAGWLEPLSASRRARHAADGRVRDELTMAAGAQ
jgi:hypothetical protein